MKHFPLFGGGKKSSNSASGGSGGLGASQSQILRQTVQSVFPEANPWRAAFSQTFICNNGQDNIPIETIITKKQEQFTFIISQCRGKHKTMGQDCMGIAKHGDWEVLVLSDGHDDEGHLVSQGVCAVLPSILLRLIEEEEARMEKGSKLSEIHDDLIYDAFDECEAVVCWIHGEASKGAYVRIAAGEYVGVAGYCTGFDAQENHPIVSVVEEFEVEGEDEIEVGYLEIVVSPEDILVPRFNGGGTCITIIRNVKTNQTKLATSGDSRVMIYLPNNDDIIQDECLCPVYGTKISQKTKKPYMAFLTPQHNVHNTEELSRLQEDYSENYVIKGEFLVNPDTNFMIQPTRGFGDHDMHGTGYTHVPQLSKTFKLPKDSLVIAASDGVFDDNVWTDRVIVDRIGELFQDQSKNAKEVANVLYEETLDRSEQSGYVDDISLICYKAPEINDGKNEDEKVSVRRDMELAKKTSLRKIKSKPKFEISNANPSSPKEVKRHTLKRGEFQLPSLVQSILDSGEGASFEEIDSNFQRINRQKSQASETSEFQRLEDKMSHKTLVKGDKKLSHRKLRKIDEVTAKVNKGGKTQRKKVGKNNKHAALLDPNADLDL